MYEYIKQLPKGDLHLHLNGAIPTSLVKKMLLESNISLPDNFNIDTDLNILERKMSLEEYLKPWRVLNKIPKSQRDLNLQVLYAAKNLAEENVKFAELRNTVFYIAELNQISLEQALEWLLEALSNAEKEIGIKLGLIVTLSRFQLTKEKSLAIFDAMKNLNYPTNLVGVDLAGNENIPVANDLSIFFKKSKEELGLGVTIHAGETGILQNVEQAINVFEADRLGHANAIVTSEKIMEEVAHKNIPIEVCPHSNYLTNSIQDKNYSFLTFLKYEVPFIICSDNPQLHNKGISEDYIKFYELTRRLDFLDGLFENQRRYTFIKEI